MNLNFAQQEHINEIEILDESYPEYIKLLLTDRLIPLQKNVLVRSVIDWDSIKHYKYSLQYEGEVELLRDILQKLKLNQNGFVIMEFGYNWPITKIPIHLFLKEWEKFANAAHFEAVLIGDNFIFEFVRTPIKELRSSVDLESA